MTKDQAYALFQKNYVSSCAGNPYGEENSRKLNVKELITDLTHHAQIKRVYVSTRGNLIILTKPIFPIDPTTHQHYPQIGRFTIRIRYNDHSTTEDDISVANRDYHSTSNKSDYAFSYYKGYFAHPHIPEGSAEHVCFGDNQDIVEQAYDKGDIYGLVDFLLLFLTTWNQDDGNPYVNYEYFYALRSKRKSNLFIEKEAV